MKTTYIIAAIIACLSINGYSQIKVSTENGSTPDGTDQGYGKLEMAHSDAMNKDFLYKTNRSFKARLNELNMPHIYAEYPGGHSWGVEPLRSFLCHLQYFNETIEY